MEFDLKNLLFSISGFRPDTELEKKLSDQNLPLEEYLQNDEAIQCFKDMKNNAKQYFDKTKIKQLIKYITEEPKENEYNVGYKYPYVAREMLKSAVPRIQEMIILPEEDYNKKYNIEEKEKTEDQKDDQNTKEINLSSKDITEGNEEKPEEDKKEKEEAKEEERNINDENKNEIKTEKKEKNLIIEIKDNNNERETLKKFKEDINEIEDTKKEVRKYNIEKHNELFDLLLDFVTKKNGVSNDVLCGYFSIVFLSFLNAYSSDIFLYLLFLRKDALEQIVMNSYQKSLANISAKLLKFNNYYREIETKSTANPGMIDLDFLRSKKKSFEDFRTQLLQKVITSIDLNGMKDQNGEYLKDIDEESIFLMLFELLDDETIIYSIITEDKIKGHIFEILEENIFDENNNIEEKKKDMYNYFVLFLTKIIHNLPEIKSTDQFYPEFDYKNIFEKIKNNKSLSFEEQLIITIPKLLTSNYIEKSILEKGPLGLHNIYIIDLILELFNFIKNKPTIFDFTILQSGFMDRSISFFFKHQLNNIYQSKFLKFFDLYLQNAENHPLLTDYFFYKKKFHLMLLDYITKDSDLEYFNKYEFKSGKTTSSCMYIYIIDLLYKIQAASGLKILEENEKKELKILNYGYFEFIKDENSSINIIDFKMPKYVSDILSESKYWNDTMDNKVIPLIKKYEGKLNFSQEMKPKELSKTSISGGVLNSLLLNLISLKNSKLKLNEKKEEPITNYSDINFWKMNTAIYDDIKNKANTNIETNNSTEDKDDEDELLNIAMKLEKEEEKNKKPTFKNISIKPKINYIQRIETNNSSFNYKANDEIKTDSKIIKNDEDIKEEEIKEEKK